MTAPKPLLELARRLLEAVEKLRPLPGLLATEEGGDLRDTILLYLNTKVLPELTAADDLPIFVGVQGGTNVGKSTVFNALAGKLLSPSVVQASATKHPLVFLHERWRRRFLEESPFTELSCQELGDPKQLIVDAENTEVIYFRFHDDDALSSLALVDSPDFDSALDSNLQVARKITALSDVTLFVTTAQKYKDRELVQRLRALKDLKASVILIFNMVDQEIVFETLVDDLEETLPLRKDGVEPFRLPSSQSQHPEDELRETLRARIFDDLQSFEPEVVKPRILRKTLERVVDKVTELRKRFLPELRFKDRLEEKLAESLKEELETYAASFNLALPEETLAIRRVVRMTEIGPKLRLPTGVERQNNVFRLIGLGLKRFNETTRDFLVRLSRSTEGTVDDSPGVLEEYAKTRNDTDAEEVLRRAESLRFKLETACRAGEEGSPLAQEVLTVFFTPTRARQFAEQVRGEFDRVIAESKGAGEAVLTQVESWGEKRPWQRRFLFVGANSFKFGSGLLLAYLLPPGSYIFSLLNWLWFGVGFFIASYLVALTLSFFIRKRKHFKEKRTDGLRAVLERTIGEPLGAVLDEILSRGDLEKIRKITKEIRDQVVETESEESEAEAKQV